MALRSVTYKHALTITCLSGLCLYYHSTLSQLPPSQIWKKNSPFLYDYLLSHALEWPSLTVEWLPETRPDGDSLRQKLLLGTHTADGEQNHVMIAEVSLPTATSLVDLSEYSTAHGGLGGVEGASRVEVVQAIAYETEINRARAQPQNGNLIAVKGDVADVHIFDLSSQSKKPNRLAPSTPNLKLTGHEKEGFGLAWSTNNRNLLVSGSDDKLICMWDIGGNLSGNSVSGNATLAAFATFRGHTGVVEDVQFNPHNAVQFASGGEDGQILMWDYRAGEKHTQRYDTGNGEINSVAFNPVNDTVFAAGSGDHCVTLWDNRNTREAIYRFRDHTDSVLNVAWAPVDWPGSNGTILSSCSSDRGVHVYDITKIGARQSAEDEQDGPPELVFIHAGHTDKVADFSMNPLQPWTFASVSDDNILQVYTLANNIVDAILPDDPKS